LILVGPIVYTFVLLNYSNATSPGLPILIAIVNQTIINITNGSVTATNITIRYYEKKKIFSYKILVYSSPTGQVSVSIIGTNISIPQFELPLVNSINNNLTIGPYFLSFNQTNIISIQSLLHHILFQIKKTKFLFF